MTKSSITPVLRHIARHHDQHLRDLAQLVAVPSISNDGLHQRDVEAAAKLTCQQMRRAGLRDVAVLRIGKSNPYAYGQWLGAPGKPTVFLYAHHDVQPTGPKEAWTSSPWKLTSRGGRLYGRGATDDKGAITAQLAAVAGFLKTQGRLPVNVKMLVEGEEEIGSPNLAAFFRKYRKRIQSDVIVVCDTENLATGAPSITYSLRGIVHALVEVHSGRRAVHSGMGGGFVPDAAMAINVLLSRLYRGDGQPPLPSIERGVLPLTPEERESLRHLPGNAKTWRSNFGLLPQVHFANEPKRHPYEQIWRRPAVTIIAQEASSIRDRSNQILPKAAVVVSCRIVPNQKPQQVLSELRKALTANPPWNVRVKFTDLGSVNWWMTDPHGPAFEAARRALRSGFGKEPSSIGGGGSIGFIRPLAELFGGAPALLLGIEDPRGNAHAADESLHEGDFRKLAASLAHLFLNLA
jgi:acetylornithine deacetylase/succinyl-diaminopimelate desuccinylase-like protein